MNFCYQFSNFPHQHTSYIRTRQKLAYMHKQIFRLNGSEKNNPKSSLEIPWKVVRFCYLTSYSRFHFIDFTTTPLPGLWIFGCVITDDADSYG